MRADQKRVKVTSPSNVIGHERDASRAARRTTLRMALGINLAQCVLGVAVGVWASSAALIGVALDNLADASVYGVSLYAIGRAARVKVIAARLSGWLVIVLAVVFLLEVLRRFFGGEQPVGPAMMCMAGVNIAANLVCLRLLSRERTEDLNIKASKTFTNNDSIINLSTVLSGGFVMWLGTPIPDLILGVAAVAVGAHGGKEILENAAKTAEGAASGGDD